MRLAKTTPSRNQKGFTLVELLIVLAIMGIVSAAIYNLFGFAHKSYAHSEAQSVISQEATLFFSQIEKEIRNATVPNKNTNAVNVSDDGQEISIYHYDGSKYERICYRRNPDNSLLLEKGSVSVTSQASDSNPDYGNIENWEIVSSHLMEGDGVIFSDRNPSDTSSSRRLIDITLSLKYPKTSTALNVQSAVMTRSGLSTESIETGGGPYSSYKKVIGITLSKTEVTFPRSGGNDKIIATIIPADATNKTLVWSQEIKLINWVEFPNYSLLYDDGTGSFLDAIAEGIGEDNIRYWDTLTTRDRTEVLVQANQYSGILTSPRETKIRVSSPDGISEELTIIQNRKK